VTRSEVCVANWQNDYLLSNKGLKKKTAQKEQSPQPLPNGDCLPRKALRCTSRSI